MRTTVVRRHHLDVPVLLQTIAILELDPRVRETHATVLVRQVVVLRPGGHLLRRPVGPAGAVGPSAIPLLQELLVLALELVVEDDTADAPTLVANLRLDVSKGAIDLDVVGQLSRLSQACVEHLPPLAGMLTPICFEEVSASVREHHHIVVSPLQRDALQQAEFLKVVEAHPRGPFASLLAERLLAPDVTISRIAGPRTLHVR